MHLYIYICIYEAMPDCLYADLCFFEADILGTQGCNSNPLDPGTLERRGVPEGQAHRTSEGSPGRPLGSLWRFRHVPISQCRIVAWFCILGRASVCVQEVRGTPPGQARPSGSRGLLQLLRSATLRFSLRFPFASLRFRFTSNFESK